MSILDQKAARNASLTVIKRMDPEVEEVSCVLVPTPPAGLAGSSGTPESIRNALYASINFSMFVFAGVGERWTCMLVPHGRRRPDMGE